MRSLFAEKLLFGCSIPRCLAEVGASFGFVGMPRVVLQVGAAVVTLRGTVDKNNSRGGKGAQCTSLKANMGHLEACAASAGLASLLATPLVVGLVPTNAQLRWLAPRRCLRSAARDPRMSIENSTQAERTPRVPGGLLSVLYHVLDARGRRWAHASESIPTTGRTRAGLAHARPAEFVWLQRNNRTRLLCRRSETGGRPRLGLVCVIAANATIPRKSTATRNTKTHDRVDGKTHWYSVARWPIVRGEDTRVSGCGIHSAVSSNHWRRNRFGCELRWRVM